MIDTREAVVTRRGLLKTGGLAAGVFMVPELAPTRTDDVVPPSAPPPAPRVAAAGPITSPRVVRPELLKRALASLDRHSTRIARRDRIAIVDFAAPSAQPRLHLINLEDGRSRSLLVAHGKGSDPSHTGWLQRFSNRDGSEASCDGAFVTADYYTGKHGRSQRLIGLDPSNSNALSRAIVVHGAWYSDRDMLRAHGMLGRSQGCFAVGESELAGLFDRLGPGRMIYAAKV